MSTSLTHPFDTDEYNSNDEKMLDSRYGNRKQLAEDLAQARALTKKNMHLPDGSLNPNRIRYEMQECIARQAFDMGFLLEKYKILGSQVEMFSDMYQRMMTLEGAYSHIMLKVGSSGLNEPTMGLIRKVTELNQKLEREVAELRANAKQD